MLSILQWYQSDRSQCVIRNGTYSEQGTIGDGFPQGSVLGPTLFICYVNHDLLFTSQGFEGGLGVGGGGFLYADYTVLYYTGDRLDNLEKVMSPNLNLLGEKCYTSLRVKLDNTLSFKNHIDYIVTTCNHKHFTLSKIRKYISTNVAVLMYKSLIMSKLSYGGIFCIAGVKISLERLQKVQNRALHKCFKADRYTSNITLHGNARVLPLYL